jgi:hypothetical protein
MKILNLISGPRNISTAMMYSFAQRTDTTVLDEPFYAVYLHSTKADHPAKEKVLASQPIHTDEVLQHIRDTVTTPLVFIKNMAHHIEITGEEYLKDMTNIFLIRNPSQIIASYAQVIQQPVMRDIGIEYQYHLFERLKSTGRTPLVVDSGLLLQNPEATLKNLCAAVGIPFEAGMLQWTAGPKPYDGVWAEHWYANVHQSKGFGQQATSSRLLPEPLVPLYEAARPYYEKMLPLSLQP